MVAVEANLVAAWVTLLQEEHWRQLARRFSIRCALALVVALALVMTLAVVHAPGPRRTTPSTLALLRNAAEVKVYLLDSPRAFQVLASTVQLIRSIRHVVSRDGTVTIMTTDRMEVMEIPEK